MRNAPGTRILIGCLLLFLPAEVFAREGDTLWEGKTAGQWAEQLAHADTRVRWYAAYALGQLGAPALQAAGSLAEILEDKDRAQDEYVRVTAAWALGRIGATDAATISALTATLKSTLPRVRRGSAEALGCLGEGAKPAVASLLEAMEDEDAVVRVHAAAALWKIAKHPKALRALLELLRAGEAFAACQAAGALGQLDAEPALVAPALVEAFHHADADVRRAAVRSIGRIGRQAGPALGKALQDADDETRRCAVESLGCMGTAALAPLTKALKNESPAARRAAARAIDRLGLDAKSAQSALLEVINDPKEKDEVRAAAARALRRVRGEEAPKVSRH